jgi:peptidyl-prolyl cis-trans isomerase SurA
MIYLRYIIFGVFFLASFGYLEAEVLDRVIATIGSEPVTLLEIKEILKRKSGAEVSGRPSETDVKEAILVLLFNREASRLGLNITEEEISDYIRRVEASNGGGPGSIEKAVLAQGFTLESYKEKIKQELERSRILAMNIRSQVQVTDEEVSKYLGEEEKEKVKDGGFYLVQLTFDDDFSQPEQLVNFIKDNKKCFTSAEFKADCISMGEVKVEDLKEELRGLVEDLELYDHSKELLADGNKSLYVRVDANFGSEVSETFLKVKEQIFQKKFMERASQFVSTEIFEKYAVEIY